jgi:hypothetical protein
MNFRHPRKHSVYWRDGKHSWGFRPERALAVLYGGGAVKADQHINIFIAQKGYDVVGEQGSVGGHRIGNRLSAFGSSSL